MKLTRFIFVMSFIFVISLIFVNTSLLADFNWDNDNLSGSDIFEYSFLSKETKILGDIPVGIENIEIHVTASSQNEDLDLQLFDGATALVQWPNGKLKGPTVQGMNYKSMHIEWSGYNGTNGFPGNEYMKITGEITTKLTVKLFSYSKGTASIKYSWKNKTITTDNCIAPVDVDLPNLTYADSSKLISYRKWNLIGNDLTEGNDMLDLTFNAPSSSNCLDFWIDGKYSGRFAREDSLQTISIDISEYEAGEHHFVIASSDSPEAFAKGNFYRSHPYYVLVTSDWDSASHENRSISLQESLHKNHPKVKITHFVGPYIFTDNSVSSTIRNKMTQWVKKMRNTYGDEIGLHIHPYCNFVETTSVACRIEPTFGTKKIDPKGYTVILSSYTQNEMEALLNESKNLFEKNGLGIPTSFRAGGWTAEIDTLKALSNEGFLVDSSANNWRKIEEWSKYDADLYSWNMKHWSSIDEYSQPYYPSIYDILTTGNYSIKTLELPDNGCLSDYTTSSEIITMFDVNWQGHNVLMKPTAFVTGYHPESYQRFYQNFERGLYYVDKYLHADDNGPVIYETVTNMAKVWKK